MLEFGYVINPGLRHPHIIYLCAVPPTILLPSCFAHIAPFTDFCDLDDLPEVLAAACTTRDTYAESAAIATQLTKPKGGKKKKARLFVH